MRRLYEDHTRDAAFLGHRFIVYEPSDDSYYATGPLGAGLWCYQMGSGYQVLPDDGFYARSLAGFRRAFGQYLSERMAA